MNKNKLKLSRARLAILLLLLFSGQQTLCGGEISETVRKYKKTNSFDFLIYVKKNEFKLTLYNKHLKVLLEFPVAIGLNPDMKAKLYMGDNRTPEGTYYITKILTQDHPPNSYEYKRLQKMNSVYFYASEGHYKYGNRKKDLGRNAYGYGFMSINYPNEDDKKRYSREFALGRIPKDRANNYPDFGDGIAIHGTNDPDSIGHCASNGCVRLLNEDLKLLVKFLKPETPVIIER